MNQLNPNLLKKVLKKENLRYTQQRQAIWDELCSSEEHRDAEEIYLSLRKNVPVFVKGSLLTLSNQDRLTTIVFQRH